MTLTMRSPSQSTCIKGTEGKDGNEKEKVCEELWRLRTRKEEHVRNYSTVIAFPIILCAPSVLFPVILFFMTKLEPRRKRENYELFEQYQSLSRIYTHSVKPMLLDSQCLNKDF